MTARSILLTLASLSAALAAGSVGPAYPEAPRIYGLMLAWVSGACMAASVAVLRFHRGGQ